MSMMGKVKELEGKVVAVCLSYPHTGLSLGNFSAKSLGATVIARGCGNTWLR